MSQDNVEIVRRMYDAFHAGHADKAISYFDANVLVDVSNARPDVAVGKGPEHMAEVVTGWIAAFEDWNEEIEEIRDLGSRVLVLSVQRGRGKGSGVGVEAHYSILYDLDAGRISAVRMYRNASEALEAAGLSE
jgi:ketosteroid isomerase-like protein